MKCLKCQKTIESQPFYGLHTSCFLKWFQLDDSAEFHSLDLKSSTGSSADSIRWAKTQDSFYHGRYRKYSARLHQTQYILKVQETKYPDLPVIEYICNKIASLLSLETPEYYLIRLPQTDKNNTETSYNQNQSSSKHDENKPIKPGPITFVTKNFIQKYSHSTLHHIYKFLPKGAKNYNCKNIIQVINKQTKRWVDVEKFVKICLFDSFIGNNDRHGRNLGIIDTGKKKLLAPMYDNPSFIGTEKEEHLLMNFSPSGSIWTSSSKEPKIKDYINEFKKQNWEKPCWDFANKLIRQFPLLKEEIKGAEISEIRKKAFIQFLTDRLEDLRESMEDRENV